MAEDRRISDLEKLPVFSRMSYPMLTTLQRYLEFVDLPGARMLYREGDASEFMGFILSGEVGLEKNHPAVSLALYDCIVFFLGQTFRSILTMVVDHINLIEYKTGEEFSDLFSTYFSTVTKVPMYNRLRDSWKERLAGYMSTVTLDAGAVVFSEHDPSRFLAYIVAGKVEMSKIKSDGATYPVSVLDEGTMIGMSILDEHNFAKLKREEPSLALELYRDGASFVMQLLRRLAEVMAEYLDMPPD